MAENEPSLSRDQEQLEKYPATVTDPKKAEIMAYSGKDLEEKIVGLSKQAAQRLIDAKPEELEMAATSNMSHAPFDVEKNLLAIEDDFEEVKKTRKQADRIEGTTGAIYDRVKQVTDAAKSGATLKEASDEDYRENESIRGGSSILQSLRVEPDNGKVEK